MTKTSPETSPALRRRRRRQLGIRVAASVVVGIMLLLVLRSLDPRPERTESAGPPPDAGAPAPTAGAAPARGWIQIADETGRLAQQYRCTRLEPNPDDLGAGWLRMADPEIELHLESGDVVVLRGARALVHAPGNAVESGEIEGDVAIRLHPDGTANPPSLLMTTARAEFNVLLGTVECPGAITLESPSGAFAGEHLRLYFSDEQGSLDRLIVERIDAIRLTGASAEGFAAAPLDRAPPSRRAGRNPRAADGPAGARLAAQQRAAQSSPADDATPAPPPVYRLRLGPDVRIETGPPDALRTAVGEELLGWFTLRSTGFPGADERSAHAAPTPRTLALVLAAAILARFDDTPAPPAPDDGASGARAPTSLAAPPSDEDVRITSSGRLVIERDADGAARLASAEDAVLELHGAPVRMEARADELVATANVVRYATSGRRIELDGTDETPVVARSPQFRASTPRFWIASREGRGGAEGGGMIDLERAGAASGEHLHAAWTGRLDLAFDRAAAASDRPDRLGPLREAVLHGGVEIAGRRDASAPPTRGAAPDAASAADDRAGPRLLRLGGRAPTGGELRADIVTVRFVGDDDPVVQHLGAEGAVHVADGDRSLACARLEAAFAADDPSQLERLAAEDNVVLAIADRATARADRLEVDGRSETAVLTGTNVRLADDRHLVDNAERIEIDGRTDEARVVGRGRFSRFAAAAAAASAAARPDAAEELRITWRGGASVETLPDDGRRLVVIREDVRALGPDLRLEGIDRLAVHLRDEGDGNAAPERIEAEGALVGRAAGRDAAFTARRIAVALDTVTQDGVERLVPVHIAATDGVSATVESQRLWCERLDLALAPAAANAAPVADASLPEELVDARVRVTRLDARERVQIALPGGERVFADALVALENGDQVELAGEPVVVLAGDFVLDGVSRVVVDRAGGGYEAVGPGVIVGLGGPRPAWDPAEPLALDAVRAHLAATPRTLDASWTESARFAETDARRAEIDLRGAVAVASDPRPAEHDEIACDRLLIELERRDSGAPTPAAGTGMLPARYALVHLLARGDARLEQRTWPDASRSGLPRVLEVRGDHVDFRQDTLALSVVGEGRLLVREGDEPREGRDRFLAAGGAAMFRWTRQMAIEQLVDERFRAVMEGDAECIHQDARGATSTLTAQRFEVGAVRRAGGDGSTAPGADDGLRLDVGGRMDLARLLGSGGVFVRTPTRDVTCETFDYDVGTGIAEVASAPGRPPVSVLTTELDQPVRAGRVLWNMKEDTITILQAGG